MVKFEAKWSKFIATVEKKTTKKKLRYALKMELKKVLLEEGCQMHVFMLGVCWGAAAACIVMYVIANFL